MGLSRPSLKSLRKIAEATGKPLEYFLVDGDNNSYVNGQIHGTGNVGYNNRGNINYSSDEKELRILINDMDDRLKAVEAKLSTLKATDKKNDDAKKTEVVLAGMKKEIKNVETNVAAELKKMDKDVNGKLDLIIKGMKKKK
jgi:hypothetical protein